MPAETLKDFSTIRDDYRFFEEHSTEAEEDADAFAGVLGNHCGGDREVRLLDYGCGDGRFTSLLIEKAGIGSDNLELSLVEPVNEYRLMARDSLRGLTDSEIEVSSDLQGLLRSDFDVIVANHSLYYVPDLRTTVKELTRRLSPSGVFMAAMAGSDNFLISVWEKCFGHLGMQVPYAVADELEHMLEEEGYQFETGTASYVLRFPDTEENRLTICRFLMGEYFVKVPEELMLGQFRGFEKAGEVVIEVEHEHFLVSA